MADLIGAALAQAEALTAAACRAAQAGGLLSGEPPRPPRAVWGGGFADCSTAYPLAAARAFRQPARELAALLAGRMALEGSFFSSVEAAGPGFLNFCLNGGWYQAVLAAVAAEGRDYGGPADPAVLAAAEALSETELLRLLLDAEPDEPIEAALLCRQDRGNPLYRLRYARVRLNRRRGLAESGGACSPPEQALIKAAAAYPAALRRAGEDRELRPIARCLMALTDALRRCHTACRMEGTTPPRRSLDAAGQVLENGMRVLGMC